MGSELITDVINFPLFWYVFIPRWWYRFLLRLLIHLDNQMAVRVMFLFWLVPVWQDTTLIGRTLSFIFRTVRIVIGLITIIFTIVMMVFWLIVWLLAPVLMIFFEPAILVIIPFLWMIDASIQVTKRQRNKSRLALNNAQGDVNRLFQELLKLPEIQTLLTNIEKNEIPPIQQPLDISEVIKQAGAIQLKAHDNKLKVEHLFIAILQNLKFHPNEALKAYIWESEKHRWANPPWIWQDNYPSRPIGGVNRAWTGIITSELNKVSTDLTQLAAYGKLPRTVGRKQLISEIVTVLGREGKENILIIGEAGSGKSNLVSGLANQIIEGTDEKSLQFKRLVAIDFVGLTAGSVEKVKERLVTIFEEIKQAKNIILYIDQMESFISGEANQQGSIVFSALEPHLDSGDFQFIGTTTPNAFKKYIEPSEAFVRTFRTFVIPPATEEETMDIIRWKAFELEKLNNVRVSYAALISTIELVKRYIQDRVLPDSAIDVLEEAANSAKTKKIHWITSTEIQDVVSNLTHIPVRTADSKQEKQILLNLEKELHKQVVGQDKAIEEISDALRRARTGLAQEGKLLSSFLFAGATGVGKTETAKALAQVYFGSEKAMVRLDMSEYQTPDSIYRLIGPPPGREGFELGGQLTEAVRRRPFTVVLLDELEKADAHIIDVFLQLLDDARLTDGSGRTVDFSNTIIIATSNVGTKSLQEGYEKGESNEQVEDEVRKELRQYFRPEFLNRFTDTIIYRPLSHEQIKEITNLQLKRFIKTMKKKEIKIEISDELIKELAQKGFSDLWGAREINRVIREEVEEKVAKKMLEGKIEPGKTYILSPQFFEE